MSQEPAAETTRLSRQVARLERQVRWLAGALAVVTVTAVGGLVVLRAEARQGVVEAARFVLRDANGKECAELGVDQGGAPRLVFLDTGGRTRAGLGLSEDGLIGLGLFGKDGEARVTLGVETNGSPVLALRDAQGTPRARLSDEEGLVLYADGQPGAELQVWPGGAAKLRLYRPGGSVGFEAP